MHMNPWIIALLVLAVGAAVLFFLYRFGDKQQQKQQDARQQLLDNMQVVSMLVIDKKRMAMKDAGFPKAVMEQIPKRNQRMKAAVVKAKIGPQIVSLLCDEQIYDEIPVKTEVKAQISGIYIMGIKNTRNVAPPEPEKKTFFQKLGNKASSSLNEDYERPDMKNGKNVKSMQSTSKGQTKNKALNPSTKKRQAGSKQKSGSKKRKKRR